MASKATWSAREVCALVSKMRGVRTYTPREVRGLARGDNGPAVIARLAERPQDGTNRAHAYTAPEVRLLLQAVAQRHERRTGQRVSVPRVAASTTAPKTRKTRKGAGTRKTAPKAASVAPSASQEV